jgi:hypothetical protein
MIFIDKMIQNDPISAPIISIIIRSGLGILLSSDKPPKLGQLHPSVRSAVIKIQKHIMIA